MRKRHKTVFRGYFAWDYDKELQELDRMSQQGWQLVKGGCFHSRFVKNEGQHYRYQLDYRPDVEDMDRYLETFREQGWEYVNSTYNGWRYFRKVYDPSLPEEEYEIFTDRSSLAQMTRRWIVLARVLLTVALVMAAVEGVLLVMKPRLPQLVMTCTLLFEAIIIAWGMGIMGAKEKQGKRRGKGFSVYLFLLVLVLGFGSSTYLMERRFSSGVMYLGGIGDGSATVEHWGEFDIAYKDNYYLSAEISAQSPLTLSLVREDTGETVYTQELETAGEELPYIVLEDEKVKLRRGSYRIYLSDYYGETLAVNWSIE